jgi:hypothetical protein
MEGWKNGRREGWKKWEDALVKFQMASEKHPRVA